MLSIMMVSTQRLRISEHDGSDNVIKQYVWGLGYIDELIQVALNDDPTDTEQDCESEYYALCDANYNVIGLTDSTGVLVERYEYTPYGERTVFISPGSNDTDCYAPTHISRRWVISSEAQPYGRNEIGHQGLMHDEAVGLIHNRARTLQPRFGRFLQRDPMDNMDGMSLYAAYAAMHGALDPSGLVVVAVHGINTMNPDEMPQVARGMRDFWDRKSGYEQQAFIHFRYGPLWEWDALAVDTRLNLETARALKELIRQLKMLRRDLTPTASGVVDPRIECSEPIFILAYSNGGIVTKLAFEQGMTLEPSLGDAVVFAGAANYVADVEGWEHISNSVAFLTNYHSHGDMVNKWTDARIGHYGILDSIVSKFANISNVHVRDVWHTINDDEHMPYLKYRPDGVTTWMSYYMAYYFYARDFKAYRNDLSRSKKTIIDRAGDRHTLRESAFIPYDAQIGEQVPE